MPRRKTITEAQREAEAAELRVAGLTFRQIADRQGITVGTAYKRVQRAVAAVPVEAVGELRQIECERLDAIIARLWDVVNAPHPYISQGRIFPNVEDAGPMISALSGILRAAESKRKLLGLDAPARQTVTVITEDVVDAAIRQLEQELAETGASAAAD